MGINYDRNSKGKAVGPTIYFTDGTSLIMLGNEIRSSLEANRPFYVYHRPGETMITFGSPDTVVEGLSNPGFVIAPFLPDLPFLTIPFRQTEQSGESRIKSFSFPQASTSQEEYAREVETIQKTLMENGGGKIVAARETIGVGKVDTAATFLKLAACHPSAFVFCFFTPSTGCWIGASPELLLESKRGMISTMALAGSRPTGSGGEWDEKNLEEQKMVEEFIVKTLADQNFSVETDPTFTRKAGKVEHICTPVYAESPSPLSSESLSDLLHHLSPTPALCGLPRQLALSVIKQCEKESRDLYGGFCGPFRNPSEFTFYAILRCARIDTEKYCIYTGGGITMASDPLLEWKETELKATTMADAMVMK